MKFNSDIFMVIWCLIWGIFSLVELFLVTTFIAAFVHILCLFVQGGYGILFAIDAKEPFCNFWAKIKEKMKKQRIFSNKKRNGIK